MLTFVHTFIDIPAVNGLHSVHISVTIYKLNYKTVGIRLLCIMYMYRCVLSLLCLPFIHVPLHY